MNAAEFDDQFNRLKAAFAAPFDVPMDTIGLELFRALQAYGLPEVERGVTHLIDTETDRRKWPTPGKVLEAIRIKSAGITRNDGQCPTCGGGGWLETHPFLSNGMVYANTLIRCSCKPAPNVEPSQGRRPLTATEYRAYSTGEMPRDYMPEGLKAKHPERGNPELKAMVAAWAQRMRRIA